MRGTVMATASDDSQKINLTVGLQSQPGDFQKILDEIGRLQSAAGDGINIRYRASVGNMRFSGSAGEVSSAIGLVQRSGLATRSLPGPVIPGPPRAWIPATEGGVAVSPNDVPNGSRLTAIDPVTGQRMMRGRFITREQALAQAAMMQENLGAASYSTLVGTSGPALTAAYQRAESISAARGGVGSYARADERMARQMALEEERDAGTYGRADARTVRRLVMAEERLEAQQERAEARRSARIESGDRSMLQSLGYGGTMGDLLGGEVVPKSRVTRFRRAARRLGARLQGLDPSEPLPDDVSEDDLEALGMASLGAQGTRAYRSAAFADFMGRPIMKYAGKFSRGAFLAAGRAGAEWFEAMKTEEATGTYDIVGRARAGYGVVGGLVGAAVGSFFPGFFGPYIGAGVGSEVGRGLADWINASYVRAQRATAATTLLRTMQGDVMQPAQAWDTGDLAKAAIDRFRETPPASFMPDPKDAIPVRGQWGFTGASPRVYRWQQMTADIDVSQWSSVQQTLQHAYKAAGKSSEIAIERSDPARWFGLYLSQTPNVVQQVAPLISAYQSHQNNLADLLATYGLDATALYSNVMAATGGGGPVDMAALYRTHGRVQAATRAARGSAASSSIAVSALSIATTRGAPIRKLADEVFAVHGAFGSRLSAATATMNAYEAIGGRDSVAYREAAAEVESLRQQETSFSAGITSQRFGEAAADYGTTSANIALAKTRASTFWTGGAGEYSRVAQAEIANISGYQTELRNLLGSRYTTMPYATRRGYEATLKQLETQKIGIATGAVETIYGMAMGGYGVGTAQAQLGIAATHAFGTGDQGAAAIRELAAVLEKQLAEMVQTLKDPNASASLRLQIEQALPGVRGQIMQAGIQAREFQIARTGLQIGTRQAEYAPQTARAFRVGTAGDVVTATTGAYALMQEELTAWQSELAKGGLTVERQHELRRRVAGIKTSQFELTQSAIDTAYTKEDLSGYSMTRMEMQNRMERLSSMPYAPGSRFALSLEMIGLNRQRIGTLNRRWGDLQASGNLSPERAYELASQREGLVTENYRLMANISEGADERLPTLMAGVPASVSRWSSWTLAAMNLALIGHPRRTYGAISGAQAAVQDSFVPTAAEPYSATGLLNNPQATDILQEIAGLIRRLVSNTETQGAKAMRGASGLPSIGGRIPDAITTPYNEQ